LPRDGLLIVSDAGLVGVFASVDGCDHLPAASLGIDQALQIFERIFARVDFAPAVRTGFYVWTDWGSSHTTIKCAKEIGGRPSYGRRPHDFDVRTAPRACNPRCHQHHAPPLSIARRSPVAHRIASSRARP